MAGKKYLTISFAVIFAFSIALIPVYAETDLDSTEAPEWQTFNQNDILNNPVAQDILKKIEITKQQIAQIQQKDFERLEAQKELEEKRAQALASLERDLKEWEKLWEEFSFEYKFKKLTDRVTSGISPGVFWEQYNFTNSKISAGKAAFQKVVSQGGNTQQAIQAYVGAAKTTRAELIEVNSLFNIRNNLAYYNQQILFDSNGQFHEIVSGEQLRKYYEDFRTNPSYLAANPYDDAAREELSRNMNTECRDGYVLVHRFHADDYICVTELTSEMWVSRGMGSYVSDELSAEQDALTVKKLREDRIKEQIKNINNKIKSMYRYYEEKLNDVKTKYDLAIIDSNIEEREEEKKILKGFDSTSMSKNTLSQKIQDLREKYTALEENLLKEKSQSIEIMKSNHDNDMRDFVKNFELMPDVKIVWNSDKSSYEAVRA